MGKEGTGVNEETAACNQMTRPKPVLYIAVTGQESTETRERSKQYILYIYWLENNKYGLVN